jgi:hypothetical protein
MKLLKSEPQPLPLLSISAESEEYRNKLVMAAKTVTAITDNQTNLAARNAAVSLRQLLKDTEAERTRLNAPLLRGQRTLKAMSDEYCQPAYDELDRLERLAADYLQAEARRVERERQEQDATLSAMMAERLILEHQATVAASSVTTEVELAKAIALEAIANKAALAVQEQVSQPLARMDKARGQQMREIMAYEITDIEALRKAKPDCVKLVPSAAMIQELVCVGDGTPGIKTWTEYRSTFSTR